MTGKVKDMEHNDKVALVFQFTKNQRQVVVSGTATRTNDKENKEIWDAKSYDEKLVAWKSRMSNIAPTDEEILSDVPMDLPMVPFFASFTVKPHSFDFSELDGIRRISKHVVLDKASNWVAFPRVIQYQM